MDWRWIQEFWLLATEKDQEQRLGSMAAAVVRHDGTRTLSDVDERPRKTPQM